ncbi:MAG: DUF2726 domain-containing protein [Burkholderiaceae bacterium]
MSIEILLLVALFLALGVGFVMMSQGKRARSQDDEAKRARDDLDTVTGWAPEVTRLLTGGERAAHEVLLKALPECHIFSQVPLARFVRVPRRNSYAEWLTRVGHLSAEFLICDRASLVLGAVILQTVQESERGARRRARMSRVLKAAGIKVFVWREVALPSAEVARDQIIQRTGLPEASAPAAPAVVRSPRTPTGVNGKLPVAEVLLDVPDDDGPRREPPSSTWFDDLDSSPTPLDPARTPPRNAPAER